MSPSYILCTFIIAHCNLDYYREIEEQDASTAADDSEENKDIKDFFISTVSEVGTVNPVSDFKTLLAKGRPLPKGLYFFFFLLLLFSSFLNLFLFSLHGFSTC